MLSEYDQAGALLASYTARANGGLYGRAGARFDRLSLGARGNWMCRRTESSSRRSRRGSGSWTCFSPQGYPSRRDGRLSFVSLDCDWRTDSLNVSKISDPHVRFQPWTHPVKALGINHLRTHYKPSPAPLIAGMLASRAVLEGKAYMSNATRLI